MSGEITVEQWRRAVGARYPECDVCHRSIGPHGFTLASPIAEWGYFACLCPDHATVRARIEARLQWAYAKWAPW